MFNLKILMLSMTFPYPPSRGGTQVRTFNLLKYLSQYHQVTLVTQQSPDVTESQIHDLGRFVSHLQVFPRQDQPHTNLLTKIGRFAQFLQSGTPPNVASYYSPELQTWLDQAIQTGNFDVLTCEHTVNEIYVRPHWHKQLKTILNLHSSVYHTCQQQLSVGISNHPHRDRLYLPLLKSYEKRLCQKFSQIVVTTDEDHSQIQAYQPKIPIQIIANGVDLDLFPPRSRDPNGYQLMITGGMDYIINIDAACFFAQEIFPLLQSQYPQLQLWIVGANPAPQVLALTHNPQITVTGRVPRMVDYLHQATVCVVPLRSGYGMKNKTLEAMAAGVPVVGSDRALEGLTIDPDQPQALRANQVSEYITNLGQLLDNPSLRAKLSENGRRLIEKNYTWPKLSADYEAVLRKN
ncbi:MAG: glycosyltransferase family 4 protein [Snowella sp.]|nr:glycosyltransferase family 4 protein [Snowella sp.]